MKPKMKHRTKTKIAALLCSALMLFGVLDISPAFKSKAEENMQDIPMETERAGAGETYNFWTDPSHTGEWWVTCTNEDHPAYGVMNNQYRVICCENTKASVGGYTPTVLAKVLESVKETTGFDLVDVMRANTYDAKVTKNVNVTGLENLGDDTKSVVVEKIIEKAAPEKTESE